MKKVALIMAVIVFILAQNLLATPIPGNWELEDGFVTSIGEETQGRNGSELPEPSVYYWQFDGLIRTESILGDLVDNGDGTGYRTQEVLRTGGTFLIYADNLWGQEPGTVYDISIQSRSVGIANFVFDNGSWIWESWEGTNHCWGEFNSEPFLFDMTAQLDMYYRGENSEGQIVINGNMTNVRMAVAPVPEPAAIFLIGTGLVGLVGFRSKFKK